MDLNGKNSLVCGSSDGIGKAAAIELALAGSNVTLVARNETKLKSVLADLASEKTNGMAISLLIFKIQRGCRNRSSSG